MKACSPHRAAKAHWRCHPTSAAPIGVAWRRMKCGGSWWCRSIESRQSVARLRRGDGPRVVDGNTARGRARDADDVRGRRKTICRHRRGRRRSVRCRRCHHRVCTSAVGTLPLTVPDAIPDPSPRSPVPVVIDTDPGIDDCLALLLALNSPELEVRGISISYGNTYVENAFRNAVAILR